MTPPRQLAALCLIAALPATVMAVPVMPSHPLLGQWRLPAGQGVLRWVEVKRIDADGVLHIEVLARKRHSKPWEFTRLAAHMAITEEALRASIRGPGGYGSFYPEAYAEAEQAWRKQAENGHAAVCRTRVLECLEEKK